MKTLTEQYILKSRTGVYQDTSENRRKHRVGQHYGEAKKEGEEGKSSKREQREARLASYKKNLATISEAIKEGRIDPSKKEAAEALKAKLEGKITKLEARLNKKGQQKAEEPEAKKKPWANKGVGMPKSDGKKLFEGLTKEQQESVLKKFRDESEAMLRQENMNPTLVIGAIEEYENDSIYDSDDVADIAEELGVSKNESQAIIRHALGLEKKRLEGLEKEAEKKESKEKEEGPALPDSSDIKKMKEYYNKASNPERLAASIKDKDKLIRRYGAAVLLGWKEAQSAFARELENRGALTNEARLYYRNRLDKMSVDKSGMKSYSDTEKKVANSWVSKNAYKMFNSLDGVTVEWKEAFKDAKTVGGKNAMSRNGRAWTEGFVVTLKGPGGEKDFTFDIVTNEGGGLYGYSTGYSEPMSLKDLKRQAEYVAREVATVTPEKVPAGERINYEDDLVEVYDDKGKQVYHGILDYCPYKDENYKWNEADKNYDLPQGYKMVGKTKH